MPGRSVQETSLSITTPLPAPPGPEANVTFHPELRSIGAFRAAEASGGGGGGGSCRAVKTTRVEPYGGRSSATVVVPAPLAATGVARTRTPSGSQISGRR